MPKSNDKEKIILKACREKNISYIQIKKDKNYHRFLIRNNAVEKYGKKKKCV